MTPSSHATRSAGLLPGGVPRYVRCYDNGGTTADRYTVLFTGKAAPMRAPGRDTQYPYLGMDAQPSHPQGYGQSGFSSGQPADTFPRDGHGYVRPPGIGGKNHLGRRIPFSDLPKACQQLVVAHYRGIWSLS